MPKIESKPHAIIRKLSEHLGLIVTIITSLAAIGGAGLAACHWVVDTVSAQSNQRIDQLQTEMEKNDKAQQLATTRVELMLLMEHDPTNKVEIERLARHYFVDLNGNSYMSSRYSGWCAKYGGDISVVVDK